MFLVDVHYRPTNISLAPKIERKEFDKIEGALKYRDSFWDEPGVMHVIVFLKTVDRMFVLVPANLTEKVIPLL